MLDVRRPTSATPATSPARATSRTGLPALYVDGVGRRTVVTISTTGTRAAIAAGVALAPRGVDTHPVIDGGMPELKGSRSAAAEDDGFRHSGA